MEETRPTDQHLYQRRPGKEQEITAAEIAARTRWDMPILSSNPKCSISLDLPFGYCQPTSACAHVCYAAQGRQYYRRSIVKALAVAKLIDHDAEHVARKMVDEAAGRAIRIAGSGEILPRHAELLNHVERLGGVWWGMTRRVDTHTVLPRLMFSIDVATPPGVLEYVTRQVPVERRSYLRRPHDDPSPIEVAVTFPVHGHLTDYAYDVPRHKSDCPVDRKEIAGCWGCKRCY